MLSLIMFVLHYQQKSTIVELVCFTLLLVTLSSVLPFLFACQAVSFYVHSHYKASILPYFGTGVVLVWSVYHYYGGSVVASPFLVAFLASVPATLLILERKGIVNIKE